MKFLNTIEIDTKRHYNTVMFSFKLRTQLKDFNIVVLFVITALTLTRRLSADCS
jgi:hypothetical protein